MSEQKPSWPRNAKECEDIANGPDYRPIPEQFVDPFEYISYKLLLDFDDPKELFGRNMSESTANVYQLFDAYASDTRLMEASVYDIVEFSESHQLPIDPMSVFGIQHGIWKLIEAGYLEIRQDDDREPPTFAPKPPNFLKSRDPRVAKRRGQP